LEVGAVTIRLAADRNDSQGEDVNTQEHELKRGESLYLTVAGERVRVLVLSVHDQPGYGKKVRLGVQADRSVPVSRGGEKP
jgi:hypothetical protein